MLKNSCFLLDVLHKINEPSFILLIDWVEML